MRVSWGIGVPPITDLVQPYISAVLKIFTVRSLMCYGIISPHFDHAMFFFYFFPLLPIDWQPMHYLSKLICPISKNFFHCVIDIYRASYGMISPD